MRFNFSRQRVVALPLCLLVCASIVATGACTAHHEIVRRQTAEMVPAWFGPASVKERGTLDRWAGAVGPPLVRTLAPHDGRERNTLVVLSWNVALGEGDVPALVAEIRRAYGDPALVLLLQEVYRDGPEVPKTLQPNASFAGRLGGPGPHGTREDVATIAVRCGLNVYYVPSMRNGSPSASTEDRGNAILSNLPLSDLGAVELPFERQRRVAVAATATGRSSAGTPWRIRFVSAHLDNMVGPRRLWFAGGAFARARQARALVDYVREDDVAVVGGDFNTWFGFADQAFRETVKAFPDTNVTDLGPTFHNLLRLDHVFFRVPDGWRATFTRGPSRYGSDHWPLIATIEIGS